MREIRRRARESRLPAAATEGDPHLERPFIYIASLRRTGSTVLSEAISAPPLAVTLREPHLCRNRFSLKDADLDEFQAMGVDLATMRDRWLKSRRQRHVLDSLKEELIPRIAGVVAQLGVKEIRHEGWRAYHTAFPSMKVVLTARDPRDIFLSLSERLSMGLGAWRGPLTPERVAEALLEQFQYQREMDAECDVLRVRYEDLCTSRSCVDDVLEFVLSPLREAGDIGDYLRRNPRRRHESALHGDAISTARIERWRREPDSKTLGEALKMIDLMPEYCEFWGYGG